MNLLCATTLAEAWVMACQHLLSVAPSWIDTTVVIHITEPLKVRTADRAVENEIDTFLANRGRYSNHTVAETIFPGYEYKRRGVDGVYSNYSLQILERLKDHAEYRWGTYAQRMLLRRAADGSTFSPLQECIKKMRDIRPKKAAYELGLGFGFDLALYDDEEDHPLRMGGPCLSHISFKLIDKHVHLTALYRSHFYIHRAYGNLLGLARLQSFVADQVEAKCGSLVCHSTLARLEHGQQEGWSKAEVPKLIERCAILLKPAATSSALQAEAT